MSKGKTNPPLKSILKNSSSFEQTDSGQRAQDIKWDEMNILQTLHPPDKDYGFMKIDEPKTPYNYYADEEGSENIIDPEILAQKISLESDKLPKAMQIDDNSSDEEETEEQKAKKKAFEQRRKMHYNEFYAVKLARKLMDKDEDKEDQENEDSEMDESNEAKTASSSKMS